MSSSPAATEPDDDTKGHKGGEREGGLYTRLYMLKPRDVEGGVEAEARASDVRGDDGGDAEGHESARVGRGQHELHGEDDSADRRVESGGDAVGRDMLDSVSHG